MVSALIKGSFDKALQDTGFDEADIQVVRSMIARIASPAGSPSDRQRATELEEARLARYAGLLMAIRRVVANLRETMLFYPAAGLDFVSVVASGITLAVMLDRRYFNELSANTIRSHLTRCFDTVVWREVHTGVATASVSIMNVSLNLTFVGAELEEAEFLIPSLLESGKVIYLAKGCQQPSILFPPSWIARCHPVAYAIDASGPALPKALPLLYTDVIYQEVAPDRELLLARTYRAEARPPRD